MGDTAADNQACVLFWLGLFVFCPLLICAAMSCNSKSNGARCYGKAALAFIIIDVVLIVVIVVTVGSAVRSVGSAFGSISITANVWTNSGHAGCRDENGGTHFG